MKKVLFFFASAAMLMTSCMKEEQYSGGADDNGLVSFELNLADGAQTRAAVSDGTKVDKLVYAVYDENDALLDAADDLTTTDVVESQVVKVYPGGLLGKNEKVNCKLVKGHTYQILFWAQDNDCTAYDTDDLTGVTVDYTGLNNSDTRDAFAAYVRLTVEGDQTVQVTMTRPFAQVNVGTSAADWAAAVKAGMTIATSKVEMTGVANTLNLLTGAVGGEVNVTFDAAAIPTDALTVNKADGTKPSYKYLSMAYVLAGDIAPATVASAVIPAMKYSFYEETEVAENTEPAFVIENGLSSVPVKANWRTNIIGELFTNDVAFEIIVDPVYGTPDNDVNYAEVLTIAGVKGAIEAGAKNITVAEAPETDGNVVLPAVPEAVAGDEVRISLPSTDKVITFIYEEDIPSTEGECNLTNVVIVAPDSDKIVVNLHDSHVTFNGTVVSANVSTSVSTFVVDDGAKISVLNVQAGNVEVKQSGIVEEIYNLSENTVYLMGTAGKIGENIVVLPKYIENGVDKGYGIPMKGYEGLETMWAPVNVGYHPVERPYGLYFQFGRKNGQTYLGDLPESKYVQLTAEILGEDGVNDNPDPNTFYISTNPSYKLVQDWYTFEYEKQVSNFWDELQTGDRDPQFSSFGPAPKKGVNDPCPEGWRLPTYYENYSIIDVGGGDAPKRTWGEGMHGESKVMGRHYHGHYGHYLFLPASGCISATGVSELRGLQVYGWSSTTNTEYPNHKTGIGYYQESSGGRGYATYRAEAYPVRCVLENYKPETNQYVGN